MMCARLLGGGRVCGGGGPLLHIYISTYAVCRCMGRKRPRNDAQLGGGGSLGLGQYT